MIGPHMQSARRGPEAESGNCAVCAAFVRGGVAVFREVPTVGEDQPSAAGLHDTHVCIGAKTPIHHRALRNTIVQADRGESGGIFTWLSPVRGVNHSTTTAHSRGTTRTDGATRSLILSVQPPTGGSTVLDTQV